MVWNYSKSILITILFNRIVWNFFKRIDRLILNRKLIATGSYEMEFLIKSDLYKIYIEKRYFSSNKILHLILEYFKLS